MSERIKKYLGYMGILFLLTLSYGIARFANSYAASIQPSSYRSFAVSAEGKATTIPDVAKFSYSVITEGGKNIKELTDKNTTTANDAIAFLKGSGVPKADIKTTAYNVEPRTQYYNCYAGQIDSVRPCPPSEIVGYTIRQSVEVKIRDFSKIGDILNGVVVKGVNNVSDLQFTSDDPTKVEDLARADAIQKAMNKAYGVARAGGFEIGRLLSIDESSGYSPRPYYADFAFEKAGGVASPAPSIEPGSQETKINVTLRYEIR
ncbi:MAG: SIMPL domain-containing protein [bacterium]|nr:SIMPL domain-containing protein [bacterium]